LISIFFHLLVKLSGIKILDTVSRF
jgi:hypothetical protein